MLNSTFFMRWILGDSGKIFAAIILSAILLSTGLTVSSAEAFSEKRFKTNDTQLIHLGYLQLAAHDLFNVERDAFCDENLEECAFDHENRILDLSTVLFEPKAGDCDYEQSLAESGDCALYSIADIKDGGEIRSSENIMISTAGAEVGEKYLKLVKDHGKAKAYDKALEFYHLQLRKAFEETTHLEFPEAEDGELTQLHNLAFRTGHDLLPERFEFDGCYLEDSDGLCSIFIIDPRGEKLSEKEQRQRSEPIDGIFAPEFLGIDFCPIEPEDLPPDGFCIEVDLLEADQLFGDQFNLGTGKFDSFMADLEDGHFDEGEEISDLFTEAFAVGLYLE
jgi:hypothetical protein